ncbi:MAG: tetratricopeptide repeat protein [Gammaproteobacteria bacterium]|jgi:TPR repeat protein
MLLHFYSQIVRNLIVIAGVLISLPTYSQSVDNDVGAVMLAANEPRTENLPAAVVWYLEMAEQGDKDAQYNLGSIYETGFGVNIDMKEAVKWYSRAAQQGHQVSQLKLGMLYHLGKGAEQSTIKGNKWIREAAKSGNELAILLQDEVIAHDVEKDIDPKKLITKTLRAFEKGQINAQETLRLELQKIERARRNEAEKPRFAGTVSGSAAKAGTVKNQVPDFLKTNPQALGPAEDTYSAIRRRAQDGDPKAGYELGRMYETGNQVEESAEEAFKWYSASAAQGYPDAQYRLGLAYLYGIGTQQSIPQAGIWLNKAKDKMQPVATLLLNAISSTRNNVIDRPHSILLSWYLEQSVDGNGEAMLGLGHMFENGWGVQQDVDVAKRWYAKARSAGTKGAAKRLRQIKAGGGVEIESGAPRDIADMQATSAAQLHNTPNAARSLDAQGLPALSNSPSIGTPNDTGDSLMSKAKDYLTPVALLILGLFMGFLVFRWMRGNQPHDSAF